MPTIRNWGKSWRSNPKEIRYPESELAVVQLLKEANENGRNVRIIGSGHSWTHLVPTNDILVSLDKMQGLINFDQESMVAEVWAGTKLLKLGHILHEKDAAMINLGDIDVQSIAGALSTGTHGTGLNFGTLATQLAGITLVTGNGEVLELSPENDPELFSAAQISLGALGIITRMRLNIVPLYKLEYISKGGKLRDAVANFHQYISENRNFEFYWFPYTDMVQLKLVNETAAPIRDGGFWRDVDDILLENIMYGFLCNISRVVKPFTKFLSRFSAVMVPKGRWVNYSHKIFATKRWVKFYEMEYNVPVEKFKDCFYELRDCIHSKNFRVHMPLEIRYVKSDSIMISPAYGQNCVYIAVHQFRGMEYKPYFDAIEKIFAKYSGRPHFGKMNTLDYDGFKRVHPNWDKFIAIRNRLDPNGVMLNDYLKGIFGLNLA